MSMFRALAPALTIWAANPRALRIVLLDKQGLPQDLTGRTATMAIRRSSMLEPRITVEAVLSSDGYAWLFLLAAQQCDLIYADGQAYGLSYDVIETYAGGSLRWTGRIDPQPASDLPGAGAAPALVDLPVAELVSETDTILISERGAAGFGVEKRLKDLGRIDEATPEAMDAYFRGLGIAGAQPFAEAAEAARDTSIQQAERSEQEADRSQTQATLAQEQADSALTQADRAQTQADRSQAEADRSELAASASASAGRLYATKEEGEAVTPEGDIFYTQSPSTNEVAIVWRMTGGVAVDTGKRTPSATFIDAAVAQVNADAATATGAAVTAVAAQSEAEDGAAESVAARDASVIAQAIAEAAAQTALLSANIYASKAAGEAATANGQQFVAYGPGANYATRYLMVAGAGVEQDAYPNRAALDTAVAAVAYQITARQQLADASGFQPLLHDDVIFAVPGQETGPAITRAGDLYARTPQHLGAPLLSNLWKEVIVADRDGNPAVAIDMDDVVRIRTTAPLLSNAYKYVETTEDGTIIWAITVDDAIVWGGAPPATMVSDWSAAARGGHVWAGAPGMALVCLTDTAGDLTDPQIIGDTVRWTDFATGHGVTTQIDLSGTTEFGAAITTVEQITANGQSLARAYPMTPVTIGAPLPDRLMMFAQGVNASSNVAMTATDFGTFASASVSVSEVPVLSAGRAFLTDKASTVGVLVSCHGVGGYRFDQLFKGTIPYANLITAIRTAARNCTKAGLGYRMRYHEWTQGEADSGDAAGIYLAKLVQYQADLTADYQAIVSTGDEVIVVTTQVSNYTAYSLTQAPPMTLELLEASILYPTKFLCTGPKYHLPYVDPTHTTSAGSTHFGYANGRAMRLHRAGLWTGPLYVLSAVRTGDTVVLTFNHPYAGAPIDLNTSVVSDPGNYGVTFHQTGGSPVTVSSVAVTGDFEITVTLSETPTGTDQKIGIAATGTAGQPAGPTTGGRSCIRSAIAETDPQGRALDHYACHQFVAIA